MQYPTTWLFYTKKREASTALRAAPRPGFTLKTVDAHVFSETVYATHEYFNLNCYPKKIKINFKNGRRWAISKKVFGFFWYPQLFSLKIVDRAVHDFQ